MGDPMGGEADYQNRGKITRVWMTAIPVSNLDDAVEFYNEVLGLPIQLDSRENNWVEFGPEEPLSKIALFVPSVHDKRRPGSSTDIVFSTDSIYELHRRLLDEGVVFKKKPERQQWGGLSAIFVDPDGNEFQVVEDPEHYVRVNPTPR
jgi:catechol 2,3-dioxygenase-like lactoylglutathione lyase family enzyme